MQSPLILTIGEPAGIGPDLCVQLAETGILQSVVLCGDIDLLRQRAEKHGKKIHFHHYDGSSTSAANSLAVHHTPLFSHVQTGELSSDNANYVLNTLAIAAEHTLNGDYSGIVTAPIHKGIICQSGTPFSGHTEFFAGKTNTVLPVMVMANETLKVGLVTTHLPIHSVSAQITESRLEQTIRIIDAGMKQYFTDGRQPKIGVCGLNPHAGENGHMGREEINTINPTLAKLRQQGLWVSDALPADTLFVPEHAKQYDIILAMYHDQGLPVIKSQGFGECVNITFGLPIIRTSVDHGTALNLAGTLKANPNSLCCAIKTAQRMSANHHVSATNG